MDVMICRCNWNIPGVEALPPHYHPASINDTEEPGTLITEGPFKGQHRPRLVRDPWKDPAFLVDWKQVFRSYSAES